MLKISNFDHSSRLLMIHCQHMNPTLFPVVTPRSRHHEPLSHIPSFAVYSDQNLGSSAGTYIRHAMTWALPGATGHSLKLLLRRTHHVTYGPDLGLLIRCRQVGS
ncbi:hypothetical protein VFPPC_16571 [Pochonia chlamydosporia 170]|uniref:Uncharacterized protein n=1 Tax=Pochonia chlamydosporia 170 TaxID=1380566 RepID=A0A179F9B2_METCM|nr:hypothetical protein VFPPC_16571 [Pochonia chlamydosporia 170]OAQ61871.1 hypothetical protein VFPPC_16571 [Pochonia chlamydosporia 170]